MKQLLKKEVKGYKAFNFSLENGLYCKPSTKTVKKYAIGQVTSQRGILRMCYNGIHFCKSLGNIKFFYGIKKCIFYASVTAIGETINGQSKSCTNKLLVNELVSTRDFLKKIRYIKFNQETVERKRFYMKDIKFTHYKRYRILFDDVDSYKYFLEAEENNTIRITLSYYCYTNCIIFTIKK